MLSLSIAYLHANTSEEWFIKTCDSMLVALKPLSEVAEQPQLRFDCAIRVALLSKRCSEWSVIVDQWIILPSFICFENFEGVFNQLSSPFPGGLPAKRRQPDYAEFQNFIDGDLRVPVSLLRGLLGSESA